MRVLCLVVIILTILVFGVGLKALGATVYYVSSVSGHDANSGTSSATPFRTLHPVNGLALQPGDEVRLFCGETWRAQPLVITRSGTAGSPIVFSSHPAGCADKPVLQGALPISGWAIDSGNVYVADLNAGANAGLFSNGLNQLFRGASRLPMGRWPNLEGHPDGGYAEVDSAPNTSTIVDAELPAVDWTGAALHIKGIRWYILNREVTASVGTSLTVNDPLACFSGGCAQWGYFLNSHRATLDTEGEWFYDDATNRVYLYTEQGVPADGAVHGSAVLTGDGSLLGAVILGRNLFEHISWVTIENLRIERWFDAGITTPINLERDENQHVVIRDNEIIDAETVGIRLTTWVWNAAVNGSGPNGWRGGRHHAIENNVVDGANQYGIRTYGVDSEIVGNTVRNIGLIANLGREGMGCGFTGTNCTENGAGIHMPHDSGSPDHTSRDLLLRGNRLENIGMNGLDIFGRNITVENTVIDSACLSKGDCGAVRTFGRNNLASTPVRDVVIRNNIIRGTIGNTDGTHPDFEIELGFGIYIDNYSRHVTVTGNTVTGTTWNGALYQHSTGTFNNNTLYNNVSVDWGAELRLVGSGTSVSQNGNIFFPLAARQRTIVVANSTQLAASNNNHFMSPYEDASILDEGNGAISMNLAEWRAWSGLDGGSSAHWYQRTSGEAPRSSLVVNDTGSLQTVDLAGVGHLNLDQEPVTHVTLPAYSSQILIEDPSSLFADGFESTGLAIWSNSVP